MIIRSTYQKNKELTTSQDINPSGKLFVDDNGVYCDANGKPIDFNEEQGKALLSIPTNQTLNDEDDDNDTIDKEVLPEVPIEPEITETSEEQEITDEPGNTEEESEEIGEEEAEESEESETQKDETDQEGPSDSWTAAQLRDYLTENNIPFKAKDSKPTLLTLAINHFKEK